ncbi:hypothetical protein BDA99DRAFT_607018 [Phascolomyces articulosus]|uniref:F-box domain-containing protein n=1 Tax=Phascolomyces articulosus TaxID=60185 RepID=A0AAD5JUE8_9FUNG|nr:hypothetical protein BDA99DRAFT_607018 [Phascolomyces articulosus]
MQPKITDPFHILPFEITAYIITLLPQDARIECLQVSRIWYEYILSCAEAWRVLLLENSQKDLPLAHAASSLASFIRYLTISTTASDIVRATYIKLLQEGHFKKIQCLSITVYGPQYNSMGYLQGTLAALCQIGNTLTKLDINIVGDVQNTVTVACILLSCKSLTDLVYSTEASLSIKADMFRSLIKYGQHPSLVNLELSSPLIVGNDIGPIIQGCQALRRLVVDNCDVTVLEVMVSHSTPNLELFSFNDKIDGPPLPKLQDNNEVIYNSSNSSDMENKKQGLRVLYTSYGENAVSSEFFIPLMYKHRDTLENVRGCLSSLSERQLQGIYAKFPRFKLTNLKHLATWLEPGIQEFMLYTAIRGANKLSSITAVGEHNLELVLSTLLDKKTPLTGLNLSHIYWSSGVITGLLIQLFKKYAHAADSFFNHNLAPSKAIAATTSSTVLSKTASSLNWVKLRYCDLLVTDEVLMSLTWIKSLHDIHIGGLTTISTNGIIQMFNRLGNQITRVFLHDMYLVNDRVIVALSNLDNLSLVKLELLDEVTDQGIRTLIDIKMNAPQKLKTLEVTECGMITEDCIKYARKKVKAVHYNSPYSEYYVTKIKTGYHVSRSAWLAQTS